MTEHIGQQFGHYRLRERLGSGGFADVYLAEHIYLNTLAAVKLLHANLASDDMQSFHDEARTIARLTHPHIIGVLDFGIEQSIPYLVMEYASNGTLRQRHPRGTQVPLSLIVEYVKQLASALHYAHTQRFIHRDIKPENVLLGQNNELLLSDFGAALITHTSLLLRTQAIIGTVPYMGPEQLRGKPTPASDQYALGIVVYEWLCGYCPFQGSPVELYNLQLNEPPPSLRAKIPTLSLNVEQVVLKALAKYPEQRFVNIQAFADALEQASKNTQASPLFLPGNMSSSDYIPSEATAPSPLPPTIVAPLPAIPLPETLIVSSSISDKSFLSRRAVLSSLAGLAVVSSGGLAFWLMQQGKRQSTAAIHPKFSPTVTPIPTKSDPLYTYTGHQDQVFSAAWAPNDQYIASAGGNIMTRKGDIGVHVWETKTAQDIYVYPGHTSLVRMVAWSPLDDKRIASASEDHTVHVWDATTGSNPLIYTGHTDQVRAVTWNHDGTHIASGGLDHTVQIWDATTADKSILTFTNHTTYVTSVAWSPDGTLVASASGDGVVYVWNSATGEILHIFHHNTTVGSIAWSLDSRYIATGDYNSDDRVRIWDVSTGDRGLVVPTTPNNPINTVAWSPSGKYVVAGYSYNEVKIWRIATGEQVLTYLGHTQAIICVQWSHSGSFIASGGFDNKVQVWTYSDL
ncbi:MAG: hypothetical protein NVS4B1_03700 [Ktedonobacteraceae bacterium]